MPATEMSIVRWNSWEFYLYYFLLLSLGVYWVLIPCWMSTDANPEWGKFQSKLSKGWIFGRLVDNSDAQYSGIRAQLPLLTAVMAGHVGVGKLVRVWTSNDHKTLLRWNLAFSLVFILILHGPSGLFKILSILSLNYFITIILPNATRAHSKSRFITGFSTAAVWLFGIAILFLNDWNRGYRFKLIFPPLAFLDGYTGMISRWHITFNFTVLRMISFVMDFNWSLETNGLEKKTLQDQADDFRYTEKGRILCSQDRSEYSFSNYLTYCLYTPLYLAGPIVTFNSFLSNFKRYPSNLTSGLVINYALRVAFAVFLMEIMMHTMYVVSMSKTNAYMQLSALQLASFSYWNLKFIWMKLFIIWRFFRLWSLADGVWADENMVRCMSNNYSPVDFWRTWHRSFNRWLIRYVYIPLGGVKWRVYNTFIIFTFVAVWHDIELRLLMWGWLIALFILPELLFGMLAKRYMGDKWYYRFLCGFGAALNITTMIFVNLVGFTSGALEVMQRFFQVKSKKHRYL